MANQSYIKLYRKIAEWEHYKDSNVKVLFLHLLLFAVNTDIEYLGISLKSGQYAASYPKLSAETGLTVMQVRTAMNKLIQSGDVSKETIKYSAGTITVYTVIHYSEYQGKRQRKPARDTMNPGHDDF